MTLICSFYFHDLLGIRHKFDMMASIIRIKFYINITPHHPVLIIGYHVLFTVKHANTTFIKHVSAVTRLLVVKPDRLYERLN